MTQFSDLHWISSHIGFVGDSVTVFFNLHFDKTIRYAIIDDRMRTPGSNILLNWAWHYPRWYSDQVKNEDLYLQLNLGDCNQQFRQAHFMFRENELLNKFPGCRVTSIMAEDEKCLEVYYKYGHVKVLDKPLFDSWYQVQKDNFPLHLPPNRDLADRHYAQGMTPLQYRAIAYLDWQGKLAEESKDPIAEWYNAPYLTTFMENHNTVVINNNTWRPLFNKEKQSELYIDRLANPITKRLNNKYYLEVCEMFDIRPDLELYKEFWSNWLNNQPSISYQPNLKWVYKKP